MRQQRTAAADLDRALARSMALGDADAFAELVRLHRPWLEHLLHRLCRDEEEARDGAQETLFNFWLARERFDQDGCVGNYLYTSARNWWRNRARARRARPRTVPLAAPATVTARPRTEPAAFPEDHVEAAVLGRLARLRVREAVDRLPEPHRDVLVLGHLQGLPYARVAELLGVSIGTVKSRTYHAVRKLKTLVTEMEVALP